jgi:hypothetical protein
MRSFRPLLLAAAVACAPSLSVAAPVSGADQLRLLDKTTASAYLEFSVSLHPAPDPKSGKREAPEQYAASLLLDRPGQFRLVLDPGGKREFRAVGDEGLVRWLDLATGAFGKAEPGEVIDPLANLLLGTVGELGRLTEAKDLVQAKDSPVTAVQLQPLVYGSDVLTAQAWLHQDQLTGLAFDLRDGRRVFVAVTGFEHNPKTAPGDFEL